MTAHSDGARILHLGDISGTSKSVIEVARTKGLDWVLRDVPAGRGANPALIMARRLRDLVSVRALRPRPDVLHINYGVSGYYGWGRKNVVLHLHGTDVRSDLLSPVLGPVVRHSIKSADVVLFSTPDMGDAVHRLRPDAQWFPAPLPPAAATMQTLKRPRAGKKIFFASRWDDSKGAPGLLELAASLQRHRTDLELVGLDWGSHAGQARDLGLRLLPLMSTEEFRMQLAESDVVIGQIAVGALGLSDLEAMAQGRPLVARFTLDAEYGGPAPLFNTEDAAPLSLVQQILADPAAAAEVGARGREWALAHHGAEKLEARLEAIYEKLL
ncbi:glycosyltransferase [Arthrobacter sp. HY1533]|uniref:glycosyltransferase n=1 Tax=Arthrobacter sp. HY1533 TaxID=2970919 RepID=UPI0022B9DE89|nr:glycosyltransferase [Arthrobacter sp. HY1533]